MHSSESPANLQNCKASSQKKVICSYICDCRKLLWIYQMIGEKLTETPISNSWHRLQFYMLISETSLARNWVSTSSPVWECKPFAAPRRFERAKAGADPARMGRRLNWVKGVAEGKGGSRDPPKTQPCHCGPINLTQTHTDSKYEHAPLFLYVLLFLHIHLSHNFCYFFSVLRLVTPNPN